MDLVSVFYGAQRVERANCPRVVSQRERCISDDDCAAGRDRKKKPVVTLSNEVECDEAYVVAGHKGQPEVVKSKERQGRRRRLQGKAGRGI